MNKIEIIRTNLLVSSVLYLHEHEVDTEMLPAVLTTASKYLVYSGVLPTLVSSFTTREELDLKVAELVPSLKSMMEASGYGDNYHEKVADNVGAVCTVFCNMVEDLAKAE